MKIELRSLTELRAPESSKISWFSRKREKNETFCEIRLMIFWKVVIFRSGGWSKSDQRGDQKTALDGSFVVRGIRFFAICCFHDDFMVKACWIHSSWQGEAWNRMIHAGRPRSDCNLSRSTVSRMVVAWLRNHPETGKASSSSLIWHPGFGHN